MPTRALFDDLETAHRTITSRSSRQTLHSDSTDQDLSSPLAPAPRRGFSAVFRPSDDPFPRRSFRSTAVVYPYQPVVEVSVDNIKHSQDLSKHRSFSTASSGTKDQRHSPLSDITRRHDVQGNQQQNRQSLGKLFQNDDCGQSGEWEDSSSAAAASHRSSTSSHKITEQIDQTTNLLLHSWDETAGRSVSSSQRAPANHGGILDLSIGQEPESMPAPQLASPHTNSPSSRDATDLRTNGTLAQFVDSYRNMDDTLTGEGTSIMDGKYQHNDSIFNLGTVAENCLVSNTTGPTSEDTSIMLQRNVTASLDDPCSDTAAGKPQSRLQIANESRLRRLPLTSGQPPIRPLPPSPVFNLRSPPQVHIPLQRASFSDLQSLASSYGETRSLLMCSPESRGRGVDQRLPGFEMRASRPAISLVKTLTGKSLDLVHLSLSGFIKRSRSGTVQRRSQLSSSVNDAALVDAQTETTRICQPIGGQHHLSAISGHSNLSGSVYFMSEDGDALEAEFGEETRFSARGLEVLPLNFSQEKRNSQGTSSSHIPIAAFDQRNVLPGYLRLPLLGGQPLSVFCGEKEVCLAGDNEEKQEDQETENDGD